MKMENRRPVKQVLYNKALNMKYVIVPKKSNIQVGEYLMLVPLHELDIKKKDDTKWNQSHNSMNNTS